MEVKFMLKNNVRFANTINKINDDIKKMKDTKSNPEDIQAEKVKKSCMVRFRHLMEKLA